MTLKRAGVFCLLLAASFAPPGLHAQTAAPPPAAANDLGVAVEIEPQALAILKGMADALTAARTMQFRAVATYESPARTGVPLAYMVQSDVTMQRPDRLRVTSPGDGPATVFNYDGKTMQAFDPAARLLAVADAPPTIDAMLKQAFDQAAIYFPFTDVLLADPMAALSDGMKLAFVVGRSVVVGAVPTDIVVFASDAVHVQVWIGVDDKLPRMVRASFADDPGRFRHVVELSNWQVNKPLPADAFAPPAGPDTPAAAFARPDSAPQAKAK